jgi:hypothetical protein
MLVEESSGLKPHVAPMEATLLCLFERLFVGHGRIQEDVEGLVLTLDDIQPFEDGGYTIVASAHTDIATLRPTVENRHEQHKE